MKTGFLPADISAITRDEYNTLYYRKRGAKQHIIYYNIIHTHRSYLYI